MDKKAFYDEVALIADEVHRSVRDAATSRVPTPTTGQSAVISMMGVTAGFFSAGISTIDDMLASELIDADGHARCYAIAMDLCKSIQIEVQKQVMRDIRDSGHSVPEDFEEQCEDGKIVRALNGEIRKAH